MKTRFLSLGALLLCTLAAALPSRAATFSVQNTNDSGAGSLRQALLSAKSAAGDDAIVFDSSAFGTPQTITLSSGELLVDSNVSISGSAAGVAIRGNSGNSTGSVASRIFEVASGVSASIANVSLVNGTASSANDSSADAGNGGAILNRGTLSVSGCTLSNNLAINGAGFYNRGTLNVTNCTLFRNQTIGGTKSFYGESGGGIYNEGTLSVSSSTLFANSAYVAGGGIFNSSGSSARVSNSIIAGSYQGMNVSGAFTSGGFNLIGQSDGTNGFTAGVNGDKVGSASAPIDPGVGSTQNPPQNNGGPTPTLALQPDSPALDAGNATDTDQRGLGRPVDFPATPNASGGNGGDIGAFEAQQGKQAGFSVTVTPSSTQPNKPVQLSVRVVDANGFTVQDYTGTVHFSSSDAGAVLPADYTFSASDAGTHLFDLTFKTPGSQSVTVSDAANSLSRTLSITVSEAPSLVVNTLSDASTNTDGLTSLREALGVANANPDANTISFDASVFATAQTITLNGNELLVSGSVTIAAPSSGLTLSGNNANRIFNIVGGTAALSGLTLTGGTLNSATDNQNGTGQTASAIIVQRDAALLLSNCVLTGNSTGSAIYNRGAVTATSCTLSNNSNSGFNYGAGLYNIGTATITNSTLSGNAAGNGGGAIYNGVTLSLSNCTLSGNSANSGGAIENTGTLSLSSCTLAGNTASSNIGDNGGFGGGGGIFNAQSASLTLGNTILSNEKGNIVYSQNQSGALTDKGYNLSSDNGGGFLTASSDKLSTDPKLGALQNNGGPTQTLATLPGSPAINAGDPAITSGTDGRGAGFPRVVGGRADIGAFEAPNSAPVATNVTFSGIAGDPFSGQLTASDPDPGDTLTFALTNGTLPDGLTLNTSTGLITGTPTAEANGATVSFSATDNNGAASNTATATFNIAPRPVSVVVTTSSDVTDANDGLTSLREAITFANTQRSARISFDPQVFGSKQTIALVGSSLPNITGLVDVLGPSAGVVVSANLNTPLLTVQNGATSNISAVVFSGSMAGLQNGGTVALSGDTFTGSGTGLVNTGSATLVNSSVQNNGTGISNTGTLGVNRMSASGNTDVLLNASGASATLSNSSLLSNGNGIQNSGTLTVQNSTLAGNGDALRSGGANVDVLQCTFVSNTNALLISNGTLNVMSSTISGNGGGIKNTNFKGAGTFTVQNTISTSNGTNLSGSLSSTSAYNFIGGDARSAGLDTYPNGFPRLHNNGGPTLTVGLVTGSPAIDAANPSITSGTDQRGTGFARVIGGRADIGAFELDAANPFFPPTSLVVTTLADEDNGTSDSSKGSGTSLREAINAANALGGATITFDSGVFGSRQTIALGAGPLPDITGDVAINAPDAGVEVDGSGGVRIVTIAGGRTRLSHLTLSNASVGVQNNSTLLFLNGSMSANGTGLVNANGATASVQNSLVQSNGVGINNLGSLTIGAMSASNNTDAVLNRAGAGATIQTSTFVSNGNGIQNGGTLTLQNSTLAGNGDALRNNGSGALASLTQNTFVSNTGALLNRGGTLNVLSNTVAGNGGGLVNDSGTFNVRNTISASNGTNVSGTLASNTFNLLNVTAQVAGLDTYGNGFPRLASNGGPTATVALISGSPAINAGDPAITGGTDQRGFSRVVGGQSDVGAFEAGGTTAQSAPSAAPKKRSPSAPVS